MFRTILLLVSFLITLTAADTESLTVLKKDAIVIGEGNTDAYVFADPKCLYSQDFIDTITHNMTLRKRFRYYIFLFDMPQVNSSEVIDIIYASPDPKTAMETYMLSHKLPEHRTLTARAREKILRIKEAADWLAIEKTPYMVIDKKH